MTQPSKLHAADRLIDAINRCGAPVCVGVDPVLERLPSALAAENEPRAAAAAIRSFTLGVLDAVCDAGSIPCVKFQSACYERYRSEGVRVLDEMIAEAKRRNLEVILDAKRGDIGVTAEHYAAAAFGGAPAADWLTINSYLGPDAIEPFLREGRGCFALVRTSNPGSDALQTKRLETGANEVPTTVAEQVGRMVAHIGERCIGESGFSALGAVVGATKAEDAARLREIMPRQMFLVPGYGAQGGSATDVQPCFRRVNARSTSGGGRLTGAIVAASRSVIYSYGADHADWVKRIAEAAKRFADEIARRCG